MIEVHGSPHLVFLRRISFQGDADAIRVCTGYKGASGLKCCPQCLVAGSSVNVERFKASSTDTLRDIARYLQDLPTKASRDKGETTLGWNMAALTASFLLKESLRSIIALGDVLFDPMHVFVANGIVNQELGLWYSRLHEKSRFELGQFQRYVQHGWKSCARFEIDGQGLVKTKLWQMGRDYRGDAQQTLSVLPLAVAFSEEVLHGVCPQLSAEIQCLEALYKVILAWLKGKRSRDASQEASHLATCQRQHMRLFVATYGWEVVRPKMHYSLHLPNQFRRKGFALDAFPTERKHRYFKNTVANSVRRISDFASVAMLKLTEYDMNTTLPADKMQTRLLGRVCDMDVLAPVLSAGKAVVSHRLEHCGQTFGANQYLLLNANPIAVAVQAAVCADSTYYLLCHELIKCKEGVCGLSHWRQRSDDYTCVPLLDVASSQEALYHRSEPSENGKHVSLLIG